MRDLGAPDYSISMLLLAASAVKRGDAFKGTTWLSKLRVLCVGSDCLCFWGDASSPGLPDFRLAVGREVTLCLRWMWSTLGSFLLLPHKPPSLHPWESTSPFSWWQMTDLSWSLQQLSRFCCANKNFLVSKMEQLSGQPTLKQGLCWYKLCQCVLCCEAWKWCGCLSS